MELPHMQERAQEVPGPLPSWKNISWLGAGNKENSGYSTHRLPPPLNTSSQPRTNPALGNRLWFLQAPAGKAWGLWLWVQQNGFCLAPSL